jgi:hypothetical protein
VQCAEKKLLDKDTNVENDTLLLKIINIYDNIELFINYLETKTRLQSYRLIMGTIAFFLLAYFIGQS